ncbi:MAG: hypothetical protein EOO02_03675, partial [Chitinophagaceae bacterium]
MALCLALNLLNLSCKQEAASHVNRAFYYWKSVVTISDSETSLLDTLNTKKLYLKFFDIVKNKELNQAMPIAKLESQNKFPASSDNPEHEFVPVIFITNDCFTNSDTAAA